MANHASSKVKSLWKKTGAGLKLKQFVRDLVASGDQVGKDWFANKAGEAINAEKEARRKNKGPLLLIISQATKSTRRKTK